MKTSILLISFLFIVPKLYPQSYQLSFSFGDFNNAEALYINSAGIIYITDSGSDEVYSYDTLGRFINETGGYGWNEDAFDDPVDIFASTLNVYVCDKNNHRIQRFDKDLNYISQLSTRESSISDAQFGYPLSCASSPQGDLYILDSENNRIVKFDMFGNYIQNFGGYDAGDFSLKEPVKIAISPSGEIYVLDSGRLVLFDQYGNGMYIKELDDDFSGVNIIYDNASLNTSEKIFHFKINSSDNSLREILLKGGEDFPEFKNSAMFNKKIFILTSKEVLVFDIPELK